MVTTPHATDKVNKCRQTHDFSTSTYKVHRTGFVREGCTNMQNDNFRKANDQCKRKKHDDIYDSKMNWINESNIESITDITW